MIGLEFVLDLENISLKQIAEQLEVSPQVVGDWIKCRSKIPKKRLKPLSEIFGLGEEIFQKTITLTDKLRIQISLIENESKIVSIPGAREYIAYEDELKDLKRKLQIEEKKETIINRYTKILEDLSAKISDAEKIETQEKAEQTLNSAEYSMDYLLTILEHCKNTFDRNEMIKDPKLEMTKEILYFLNNFFGIDEKKWDKINPFVMLPPIGPFYKELTQLQKKYYAIVQPEITIRKK